MNIQHGYRILPLQIVPMDWRRTSVSRAGHRFARFNNNNNNGIILSIDEPSLIAIAVIIIMAVNYKEYPGTARGRYIIIIIIIIKHDRRSWCASINIPTYPHLQHDAVAAQ